MQQHKFCKIPEIRKCLACMNNAKHEHFGNELVRVNTIQFSKNVCIAGQVLTRNREYVINAFKSHSLVVHVSFEMKQICMMCARNLTYTSFSQIRHHGFNILFLRIIDLTKAIRCKIQWVTVKMASRRHILNTFRNMRKIH